MASSGLPGAPPAKPDEAMNVKRDGDMHHQH
jgi:hypothetical protein